jgi:hypothetical protein
MKGCCILVSLFFIASPALKAQNRQFIAGAIAGFYGIEIKGDIREMYSPTNGKVTGTGGLSAGLNVKHDISKHLYGALELRYIRKGSIYGFISQYGTRTYESIKLDYIEIPLLLGIKINLKKKHLYTETGFAYGRMISSFMIVSDLNKWDYTEELDHFKQDEVSWVLNVKYPVIRSEKLLVGARLSYSLFTIHSWYRLYNMDYGVEVYYLFNRTVK